MEAQITSEADIKENVHIPIRCHQTSVRPAECETGPGHCWHRVVQGLIQYAEPGFVFPVLSITGHCSVIGTADGETLQEGRCF